MDEPDQLAQLRAKLTPKQRKFAECYVGISAGNGTDAAERAGYKASSRGTLSVMATENLRKPMVSAYVSALLAQNSISPAEILHHTSRIAATSLQPYLRSGKNGDLYLDIDQMRADGALGLVAGLDYSKQGKQIVKFHDRLSALTLLARMHGMLTDRTELTGAVGVTVREYPEGI